MLRYLQMLALFMIWSLDVAGTDIVFLKRPCPEVGGRDFSIEWTANTACQDDLDSFRVYYQKEKGGPWIKLGSLDSGVRSTIHSDGALLGELKYKVVQYGGCRDSVVSNERLADISAPVGAVVRFLDVEDGRVRVYWKKSKAKDVEGYVVYNQQDGNREIVRVPGGDSSWLDESTERNPEMDILLYNVAAFDSCGNTSPHSNSHNTLMAQIVEVDTCRKIVSLELNAYQGFEGSIEGYDIVVDGEVVKRDVTVPGVVSVDLDGKVGSLSIWGSVRMRDDLGEVVSKSNSVSLNLGKDGADSILIRNLGFEPKEEGILFLDWVHVGDEFLGDVLELHARNDVREDKVDEIPVQSVEDRWVLGLGSWKEFRLVLRSSCGEIESRSKWVGFLNLTRSGKEEDFLFWNIPEFAWERSGSDLFHVEFLSNATWRPLVSIEDNRHLASRNQFEDAETGFCYRVYTVGSASQSFLDTSFSETVCGYPEFHGVIPTAFSPNGDDLNDLLVVPGTFLDKDLSTLEIYDRWGSLLHKSVLSNEWDGILKNGERISEGLYIMKVTVVGLDGNTRVYSQVLFVRI